MSQDQQTGKKYHHGNLPAALIQEGAQLLADSGVDGFSLRQLAKRTGVTVAAPSHHFGSVKGLFTAIATEGFAKLARKMLSASEAADSPEQAVRAMCTAYLDMSATDPGYGAVMFRLDLLDAADQDFRARAFHTFGLLQSALSRAAPGIVDVATVSTAAKSLWATTHGLAALPMIEDGEAAQILQASVAAHLTALKREPHSAAD